LTLPIFVLKRNPVHKSLYCIQRS